MKYTVFSETAKKTEHAEEKKKVFTGKKRRLSAADGFNKIDKALEAFMNYQQEADRRFWETEEERTEEEEFIVTDSHMTSCNQGSFSKQEREPWELGWVNG